MKTVPVSPYCLNTVPVPALVPVPGHIHAYLTYMYEYIYVYTVGTKSLTRFFKKSTYFCGKIYRDMVETSVFFCLTGLCHKNRIEVKNIKNS